MTIELFDSRLFPATTGTAGDTSAPLAIDWLADWSAMGGGISIDREGALNAWRFADMTQPFNDLELEDFAEGELLHDLHYRPGLAASVRVVLAASAYRMAHAARLAA